MLAVAVGVPFVGCGERPETSRSGPPSVVVSIPPLVSMVESLVTEETTVKALVPAGRTVHGFEPTSADVAALARSTAIVSVGLGLEERVSTVIEKSAALRERSIDLSELATLDTGDDHHGHHHHHGHEPCDLCGNGLVDPHLWLDPPLLRELAPKIWESLPSKIRRPSPEALLAEIDAIDAEYRERLAPHQGAVIVTAHNAFGRLAECYGLEVAEVIRPVETAEPGPARVAEVARAIQDLGVRAIFIEPQFDADLPRRLAETTGIPLGTLDPLGQGDWSALMRANLDALVTAFEAHSDKAAEMEPTP